MKCKKGQISIFLIIGIILFVIIVLVLFLNLGRFKREAVETSISADVVDEVKANVQGCIDDRLKVGIDEWNQCNNPSSYPSGCSDNDKKELIKTFMITGSGIRSCVDFNRFKEEGLDISGDLNNVDVEVKKIGIDIIGVNVKVDYPITIKKGSKIYNLREFTAEVSP